MLAVGAGGGCLDIFTLLYPSSPLSPTLWETTRYRLKYCLKGPLNPKTTTTISGRLPERGRKKRGVIDERKNVQTTPPAPTASTIGPCPAVIQARTPRHWKFTQHLRTTRTPPIDESKNVETYPIRNYCKRSRPLRYHYQNW